MESVGLEESAGGGSKSSTVAWSHVNSYRCDPKVKVNLPRDIYVPMLKSLLPWVQDRLSERWRSLLMKLQLNWVSVFADTYYLIGF